MELGSAGPGVEQRAAVVADAACVAADTVTPGNWREGAVREGAVEDVADAIDTLAAALADIAPEAARILAAVSAAATARTADAVLAGH
ncbi:hypothetical protein ACIOHE_38810 [Streptomyces sp. NPDC087851]|uniref:hypothetical protein n=1 Tax=Streptomyces sp. NPDC087851 TaxID=3365810 RepID=UPI0037F352AB